jgi:hypothetical protein
MNNNFVIVRMTLKLYTFKKKDADANMYTSRAI